ncbi:hypothetical protein [Pseudoduganella sp.]|uniref:hypothetical protein n=1 Tax=Pseudoduganella sp. TaxID=1880898 RepID=UPI0035B2F2AE
MKKNLLALALLAMSAAALGGEKRQTRAQCDEKCLPSLYEMNEQKTAVHQQRLKGIRAKKAGVTDPQKLKEIALEEQAEVDRFEAAHEKFCRELCSVFPETL